jgi:hypothetical protein
MAARYQHVLDSTRKGVADQVGGLLWGTPKPESAAADRQDGKGTSPVPGLALTSVLVGERWRWDLNPRSRAFSPIPRLSTQDGEKSPGWGFHAAMVAGAPWLASSRLDRLAAESWLLDPWRE